jgi:hypothetical protein
MSGLTETLFAGSTVRLFGSRFAGLKLEFDADPTSGTPLDTLQDAPPVLRSLQENLRNRSGGTGLPPILARIYGFSYQGSYYKLAEPTVLLVYGDGVPIGPTTTDPTPSFDGIEFNGVSFAPGVLMWVQDRADYSVRIDITSGWLADVLLAPGISDGTNMTTGQAPDSGAPGAMTGRAQLVGRAQMVGRAQLVGRGNSG